jgi:hypothetical protein
MNVWEMDVDQMIRQFNEGINIFFIKKAGASTLTREK